MRSIGFLTLLATLLLSTSPVFAQTRISDFQAEVQSGRISVESMRGNGSSSGMAVEGRIRNTSQKLIRINISLRHPMYLGNRSSRSRQNMIAFGLYERGGAYYSDGNNSYIEVGANQSLDIQLMAYCADFEKENPTTTDRFSISDLPPEVSGITHQIADYKRKNPEEDVTRAAQVALWLAQGFSPDEIRRTFEFSYQDEMKAREIMNQ